MDDDADMAERDRLAHNRWLDGLLGDIEFEPLREFIERLRESPPEAQQT